MMSACPACDLLVGLELRAVGGVGWSSIGAGSNITCFSVSAAGAVHASLAIAVNPLVGIGYPVGIDAHHAHHALLAAFDPLAPSWRSRSRPPVPATPTD
jgi:hypothetical protein